MSALHLVSDTESALRNDVSVVLPASKSIAARALVANHFAPRRAALLNLPDCADTASLAEAIRRLESLQEAGGGASDLYIGEGAASLRFFLPAAASAHGVRLRIDAAPSLSRRPLLPLIEALLSLGASVTASDAQGHPPVVVDGRIIEGGEISVPATISSQFASALMLSAPSWKSGLRLRLEGGIPVSLPYIRMTAGVMDIFGAEVSIGSGNGICVGSGGYHAPERYMIESDWSAASYFYELALLRPGSDIRIRTLTPASESLQGDSECEGIFRSLGVETEYLPDGGCRLKGSVGAIEALRRREQPLELSLRDWPDLTPAISVGLCGAGIPYRISGIGHLRHKESDRIATLAEGLRRCGFSIDTGDDFISFSGRSDDSSAAVCIAAHSDHRIAMSFGALVAARGEMLIDSPEVVEKSFPGFWRQLYSLGIKSV